MSRGDLEKDLEEIIKSSTKLKTEYHKDLLNKPNPNVEMFDKFIKFLEKWVK